MNGIVQSLTAWLVEHTYAVVFIATLVDATAIPFPGRIILAAAGALAAAGDVSLTLVIALGDRRRDRSPTTSGTSRARWAATGCCGSTVG